MDHAGRAEAAAEQLELYRGEQDGWRGGRCTSEVSVSWRPSTEFDGNLYRAEAVVPASPQRVWDCIKPVAGGARTKWDRNVKDFEVIEAVSDCSALYCMCLNRPLTGRLTLALTTLQCLCYGNRDAMLRVLQTISVCRTTTPSAFMRIISPREFVDVILMKQYEDGTMLSAATNVEHPQCPPQPNFVRGFNYPCGCFCIPLPGEPDKTQLLSFFQTDLGGYLPQTVVDSFFPANIAGFYSNLTKAVKMLKA